MAEAKRGLSSWLHKPKASSFSQQEPEPAPTTLKSSVSLEDASAATDKTAVATSPLDISLAILRAKETINRISPDKRALVEEIDVEEDDGEFDEKAHWGRRSAAPSRKKLKASRGKAQQQPNYSIKAFCVPPNESKKQQAEESVQATATGSLEEMSAALLPVEEALPIAHSEELVAQSQSSDEPHAKSSDENERSSVVPESPSQTESTEVGCTLEAHNGPAPVGIEEPEASNDDDAKEPSNEAQPITSEQSANEMEELASPAVITAGRPRRQAAIKAQELNEQARKQSPPLGTGGFITKDGAIIDLRTPPRKKPSKKNASSKRSSAGSASSLAAATQGSGGSGGELKTPVGRKRKLEMDRSTPSPGTKANQKESFFLTEQDKKQLQEIEAVAKLREQLRKTREKDLAFFSGKTAMNPFFQAPKAQAQLKSNGNGSGVGSYEDGEGTQPRKAKSKWSKDAVHFPSIQHIFCAEIDSDEPQPTASATASLLQSIPRKAVSLVPEEIVLVDDEDDEMTSSVSAHSTKQSTLFAASAAHMQEQVHAESTFSDLFWFRQYLDSYDDSANDEQPDLRFPLEFESEGLLIDSLVETYGIKEKRVREVLDGLIAAKGKRLEKERNLTLVDRYVPVTASGIIGNREPLRLLSSWLSAWKLGGDERERRSCFQAELYVFEGDDSDEDDLSDLCRLFILEGESGSGKSAAVYACAEELGYNIIEINAGQSRAGKSIVEIAGEATQSTRVLHMGNPAEKKKKSSKKKKSRKSVDGSASHLSLVLFEDVDLVFEEDKGFLTSLCSIAKHSKCPIVLTCREIPDNFPATPQRLCQMLVKPSVNEFSAWMMLVAYLEQLPLTHALVATLAMFFKCDIRQSLHFVQSHLPQFATKQRAAKWTWRPQEERPSATNTVAATTKEEIDVDEPVVIDVHEEDTSPDAAEAAVVVPAWTHWPGRSFDMLSSNLLNELSACASKPEEDKSSQEKVADAHLIESLWAVMDAVSVADTWGRHHGLAEHDDEDSFFDQERNHLKALDLRVTGLAAFLTPDGIGASVLQAKPATLSAECVRRSLEAAVAEERRSDRRFTINSMRSKMELPLSSLGAGDANPRFDLDYMPMISRILNSSASHQQSRRRASRRNHYLSGVIADMSLLDEIHEATAFRSHADGGADQIVAASPSSSPLPS
ncbi:hypothetical protein Gpo141_00002985 [Globisporangium polare]